MSAPHFHRDYETRSWIDLKKTGAHKYMQHPTTSIWCASFAMGDGPVKLWTPGQPIPAEFVEAQVDEDVECWAHNDAFEQCVEKYVGPRHGLPEFKMSQQRCTMVGAYAMALPGALEDLAPALGMDVLKDAAGKRLMLQMSKPRKVIFENGFTSIPFTALRVQEMDEDGWEVYATPTGRTIARLQWWNEPAKVERLGAYCLQDTEVERAVGKRLRPLKQSELELWHLDQVINFRGVYVDEQLCLAAKEIVAQVEAAYDRRMLDLTGKSVTACSNRNQLITWLRGQGVDTESVAKDQIADLLTTELPPLVREVLLLRLESAKASVAKIDAFLHGMDEDCRARGLLQFHAAGTGRWAGRRIQVQNLLRPLLDMYEVRDAINLLLTGDFELLSMIYDELLAIVGSCLRGMIKAAPGRRIVAADYANIEGRVLAWLAGEHWKLDAFREADLGLAPDLYIQSYSRTFGVPFFEKSDPRRKVGKTMELASGYQGGHGAYIKFGIVGEKAEELAVLVKASVVAEVWAAAEAKYQRGFDLTKDQWTALRITIDAWRNAHPATRQLWYDMESAAVAAVQNPGSVHNVGPYIRFKVAGSFLFMRLPSGRFLSYPYPQMANKQMPWVDKEGLPVSKMCLSYMGVESTTRKWMRQFAYGGLLAENATQAVARDVMADGMPRIEAAGYPIIMTVHDELVTEPKIGHGSLDELCALMVPTAEWAAGLPVSVAGFEAERYGKGE